MLNNLLALYFYDSAEPIVKWLTVAVVCAILLVGIILAVANKKTRELLPNYIKYAMLAFVLYALVIGIMMVVAMLLKRTNPAYLDKNYVSYDVIYYVLVPLIVAMGITLVCGIILFVLSKKLEDKQLFKVLSFVFGAIIAASIVSAIVTIAIYYSNHIVDDGYYNGYIDYDTNQTYDNTVNQLGLYLSAVSLVVVAIAAAFVVDKNKVSITDSHCIALAGITVALSFALSYIKIWEMPQGGSVTLASLLPVMLFAYVYGPKKGLLVGFVYGLLQSIQDAFIIHPAQFLLDYPIAFAMVGFAGVFANVTALDKLPQIKFALGAILAGCLRYVAHLLSGVFAFSAYAIGSGTTNYWLYSAVYNSFVFVDLILVIVVGVLLFSSKAFNKQVNKYAKVINNKAVAQQ
jgi:thiamine transporter